MPASPAGIGLVCWTSRGYVVQAKLAGLSPAVAIARWHYLPSLLPSLTVVWTGMFARAILGISALGFLGFGVQPPMPEWGTMLLDARIHMRSTPLQMIWPGLAVVIMRAGHQPRRRCPARRARREQGDETDERPWTVPMLGVGLRILSGRADGGHVHQPSKP